MPQEIAARDAAQPFTGHQRGTDGDGTFDVVVDTTLYPPISSHECVIHMAAKRAAIAGAIKWEGLSGITEDTSALEQGMTR